MLATPRLLISHETELEVDFSIVAPRELYQIFNLGQDFVGEMARVDHSGFSSVIDQLYIDLELVAAVNYMHFV